MSTEELIAELKELHDELETCYDIERQKQILDRVHEIIEKQLQA